MPLTKHGAGDILPEPGDKTKTAAANWTEQDEKDLAKENTEADTEAP